LDKRDNYAGTAGTTIIILRLMLTTPSYTRSTALAFSILIINVVGFDRKGALRA
jgi:hypothetical protein